MFGTAATRAAPPGRLVETTGEPGAEGGASTTGAGEGATGERHFPTI
tara:strand:- start:83 stop:223 length:141 start_codon:yes stop_codon:yes gene_type:complete